MKAVFGTTNEECARRRPERSKPASNEDSLYQHRRGLHYVEMDRNGELARVENAVPAQF